MGGEISMEEQQRSPVEGGKKVESVWIAYVRTILEFEKRRLEDFKNLNESIFCDCCMCGAPGDFEVPT